MKLNIRKYLSVCTLICILGCEGELPDYYSAFSYTYDFNLSDQSWHGDFSDYPEGDSVFFELQAEYTNLPEILNTTSSPNRKGFYITGNNHSDDLFMFLTGRTKDLKPNTTYEILFRVSFASNAPTGSVGIGGSPGDNVYLKAGATTFEPSKVLDNGNYVMNLDKGNQAIGGVNMIVLGTIGVASTTTDYKEITRYNDGSKPLIVTTDDTGSLWIVVGTDSGFEGTTSLYYTKIQVYFNEVE